MYGYTHGFVKVESLKANALSSYSKAFLFSFKNEAILDKFLIFSLVFNIKMSLGGFIMSTYTEPKLIRHCIINRYV